MQNESETNASWTINALRNLWHDVFISIGIKVMDMVLGSSQKQKSFKGMTKFIEYISYSTYLENPVILNPN